MSNKRKAHPKAAKDHTPIPVPTSPRTKDEIQKEYESLVGQAGERQYKAQVLKAELAQINQRIFELNREAAQS